MRIRFIITTCFILCSYYAANAQLFEDAWSGSGVGADRVTSFVHVPGGGFLVAGAASNSTTLAGLYIGSLRGFVARFDAAGEPMWVVPAGLPPSYLENAAPLVRLTAEGNVLVAGRFAAGSEVGDSVLQATGAGNFFLAQFDMSGQLMWLRAAGTGGVLSTGLALDTQGNIHVTGFFTGTVNIGDTVFTVYGSETAGADLFTAKFDPSGNLLWARQAGGAGQYGDAAHSVAVDGDGNVIICGKVRNEAQFGSVTLPCVVAGSSCTAGFVAKYDASGTIQWAKTAGIDCRGVATDPEGNIYVTGDRHINIAFDTVTVVGHNGSDHYTAKIDPSGTYQWVLSATAGDMEAPQALAVDQDGTSYVTGFYTGNMVLGGTTAPGSDFPNYFLYAADSEGDVLWVEHGSVVAPGRSHGYAVAIDPDCGLLVGGDFRNTPDFLVGGFDLGPAPNVSNLWLARMNTCIATNVVGPIATGSTRPFLFPVPADDQLQVGAMAGTFSYQVMNMLGAIVQQGATATDGTIPVHALAPGVYGLLLHPLDEAPVLLRFIKN